LRRSDLERVLDRSDEAGADATRALKMLQAAAQPEAFSTSLGQAYLTLGRALDGSPMSGLVVSFLLELPTF